MGKIYKKIASFILVIVMILASFSVSNAQTTDYQSHWASDKITEWIAAGLIKGYDENTFKPDISITRAEFSALVNRSFGFTSKAAISFTDVADSAWYAADIQKAKAAGYLDGYKDNTVRSENPITREEAASILSRIITINALEGLTNLASFTDAAKISTWAKEAASAVTQKGIISGYTDKTFRPLNKITRAETVVLLDKALAVSKKITVYEEAKVYGPATGSETITGDAVIAAAGAQLQNVTITGDLTIAKSVGDGNVTLKNVIVKGSVYIKGGGANSIHLNNCTIIGVYVERNGVRVVAEGTTTVQQVNLLSSATIAEAGITGTGFVNFVVSQFAPAGITASLAGNFNNVTLNADQTSLSVLSGTIVRMLVAQGADGTAIDLSNGVDVNTLNINTIITVTGTGRIDSAVSTVMGSKFETAPISSTTAATGSGSGTGGGNGVAPLSFVSIALSPAGSMTATPTNPTFIMTFDRGLTDHWTANKNCFKIYKDGSATNVLDTSAVTMIDKNNIQLSPSGLIAGASYSIVVSASLQANNGNTLGTAVTKAFTVTSGGSSISAPTVTDTLAYVIAGNTNEAVILTGAAGLNAVPTAVAKGTAATAAYAGGQVTLTPAAGLTAGTGNITLTNSDTGFVTITNGLKVLAGTKAGSLGNPPTIADGKIKINTALAAPTNGDANAANDKCYLVVKTSADNAVDAAKAYTVDSTTIWNATSIADGLYTTGTTTTLRGTGVKLYAVWISDGTVEDAKIVNANSNLSGISAPAVTDTVAYVIAGNTNESVILTGATGLNAVPTATAKGETAAAVFAGGQVTLTPAAGLAAGTGNISLTNSDTGFVTINNGLAVLAGAKAGALGNPATIADGKIKINTAFAAPTNGDANAANDKCYLVVKTSADNAVDAAKAYTVDSTTIWNAASIADGLYTTGTTTTLRGTGVKLYAVWISDGAVEDAKIVNSSASLSSISTPAVTDTIAYVIAGNTNEAVVLTGASGLDAVPTATAKGLAATASFGGGQVTLTPAAGLATGTENITLTNADTGTVTITNGLAVLAGAKAGALGNPATIADGKIKINTALAAPTNGDANGANDKCYLVVTTTADNAVEAAKAYTANSTTIWNATSIADGLYTTGTTTTLRGTGVKLYAVWISDGTVEDAKIVNTSASLSSISTPAVTDTIAYVIAGNTNEAVVLTGASGLDAIPTATTKGSAATASFGGGQVTLTPAAGLAAGTGNITLTNADTGTVTITNGLAVLAGAKAGALGNPATIADGKIKINAALAAPTNGDANATNDKCYLIVTTTADNAVEAAKAYTADSTTIWDATAIANGVYTTGTTTTLRGTGVKLYAVWISDGAVEDAKLVNSSANLTTVI